MSELERQFSELARLVEDEIALPPVDGIVRRARRRRVVVGAAGVAVAVALSSTVAAVAMTSNGAPQSAGNDRLQPGATTTNVNMSGNVVVPRVVGRSLGDARAIASRRGLKIRLSRPRGAGPDAIVLRQSPTAGSIVSAGSSITLVVGISAPTPAQSVATTPPPSSPSPMTSTTSAHPSQAPPASIFPCDPNRGATPCAQTSSARPSPSPS